MATSNGSTQVDKAEQQEMRRVKPPPAFKPPANAILAIQRNPRIRQLVLLNTILENKEI